MNSAWDLRICVRSCSWMPSWLYARLPATVCSIGIICEHYLCARTCRRQCCEPCADNIWFACLAPYCCHQLCFFSLPSTVERVKWRRWGDFVASVYRVRDKYAWLIFYFQNPCDRQAIVSAFYGATFSQTPKARAGKILRFGFIRRPLALKGLWRGNTNGWVFLGG